jgi:amino acid transporter
MSKFAKILEYVLLAVGVVIIALFYVQNGSGQFALSNLADVLSSTTLVDGLLWWVYALIVLAIALILVLACVATFGNKKSLKSTGLVLLLAVVLVVASYFLASGNPVAVNVAEQPTEATFKLTDTILILTYILFVGVIASLLGGIVMNAIKKR